MVEIDPANLNSLPKKRTALGHFKHEGAESLVNAKDGRVVIYMDDNQRFDYVYRFGSNGKVNLEDRTANLNLLDRGTLSVARFDEGALTWLPLVQGGGPLTEAKRFRRSGRGTGQDPFGCRCLGRQMDRPEDIEVNPRRVRSSSY